MDGDGALARLGAAVRAAGTLAEVAAAVRAVPGALVAEYEQGVPAGQVGARHTAVVDAVIGQVRRLRPEPALARVRHAWVMLGSLARHEALPMSDVDTGLVWRYPAAASDPGAGEIRAAAGRVVGRLRECGLEPCPNGTNADNPAYSRSERDWRAAIASWRQDPAPPQALLLTAMVADSRPLADPELAGCLRDPDGTPVRHTRFLRALLDEALRFRPSTGLLRAFTVPHTGAHRGELDLKRGGLAPVVGLARWAAIAAGETGGTTPQRLRQAGQRGLLTTGEAQGLVAAFEDIYGLVLGQEVAALRAGTTPTVFVAPDQLPPARRRALRESLRAIRSVQGHLDQHWLARLERSW